MTIPSGNREKLFEDILKQTIEGAVLAKLHPRTIISVTVQVSALCIIPDKKDVMLRNVNYCRSWIMEPVAIAAVHGLWSLLLQ